MGLLIEKDEAGQHTRDAVEVLVVRPHLGACVNSGNGDCDVGQRHLPAVLPQPRRHVPYLAPLRAPQVSPRQAREQLGEPCSIRGAGSGQQLCEYRPADNDLPLEQ